MPKYITTLPKAEPKTLPLMPGKWSVKNFSIAGVQNPVSPATVVLYEDLQLPYLTGEISVIDSSAFVSSLPVVGGEKIEMTLVDCFDDERKITAYVTGISERGPISLSSQMYLLQFTTKLAVKNAEMLISMPLKGKPEEIAESILRIGDETIILETVETKHTIRAVAPSWRIMRALAYVASKAVAKNDAWSLSPMLMWANTEGKTRLLPLDFILDSASNPVQGDIVVKVNRQSDGNLQDVQSQGASRFFDQTLAFEKFKVKSSTNFIVNLALGFYANQINRVNLLSREAEVATFQYENDFKQSRHLEGAQPFVRPNDFNTKNTASLTQTIFSHSGAYNSGDETDLVNEYVGSWLSKYLSMDQIVVVGELPGSWRISAGQKYNVKIPAYSGDISNLDPAIAGTYVVRRVKHEFGSPRHVVTIELFRDGVNNSQKPQTK